MNIYVKSFDVYHISIKMEKIMLSLKKFIDTFMYNSNALIKT